MNNFYEDNENHINNNIDIDNTIVNFKNSNNYKVSDEISSFDINTQNLNIKAEELLKEGEEDILMREKLMFEPQSISLCKIYKHFFEPIDWLFLILAIIGAIGTGASIPAIIYIGADTFSNIGNTGETRNINAPPHILQMIQEMMKQSIHKSMNRQIRRYLITGAVSFICNFLNGCFWLLIGYKCSYNFKKKYFTLILSQEQGWFDSYNTYELSTKVQAQIEQFEQGIGIRVGLVLSGISQFILGFLFAFLSCWKVSLVMVVITPIVVIFYIVLAMILRKGIIMERKIWENAGGMAEEMLYNIKTVASFANFDYELKRFFEKVDIVWRIGLINSYKLGFFNGFIIFFLYLCLFICFIYGRTLIGKDHNPIKGRDLTGGDVFSAGLCTFIGLGTIGLITPNIKGIQESCTAASDYFNLYKRKPQMDFSLSIEKPPISQFRGKIEFRGVNFSYPSDPKQRLILNNINLTFDQGKKIALIGESGCGKSTIVNLIERLYDITGGQLLIDGIEINKYDIKYLRNFIGYVQQEPVLLNTSIRENIIFGRKEYLSSIGNIDELIQNACDDAYCTEFINNLKDGLDYVVGIKGSKLSAGQKQRIAIARAILSKPKILILDEATSSLDNKSEIEVQRALDNISHRNITTIIISHRLSTIKNADYIYVIKNGNVLEQGSHSQLLESKGYYTGLVNSQLTQDEEILNNFEEISKEKIKINRKKTTEEIQFEMRDNAISLSEKDISVRPCAIITELSEYKLDLFLACLGALIVGGLIPVIGFFSAKTIIALNSRYQTIRYDDGLKYSLVFLAFAVIVGIAYWLMSWKFMSLGLTLARIYRKKLMAKYLSFHLSYFDVTKNSPGALLTRMSINTMELGQMLNSILGISIQCGSIFIVGLIIGCCYQYRLILIDYSFIPIIIIFQILRRYLIENSSKRSIEANIEAGGILSECVINTKTIFSFNFQHEAIRMYLQIIDYHKKQFICDAILMGLFMGLGYFCYFASTACVYTAARYYMVDGSMDSEDMTVIMNTVNISMETLVISMGDLGNIKKANVAFRSIYSTLETYSLIPPFKKDNIGKITAVNIKGKIEFKNVYFAYPTRPENIILKDISLTIMPGQNVALVGPSGSGKSTIIQLLNRFYDVEEGKGEILIDDINIKNYNLYELRKKIGLVSQEPSLFRVSPIENVRYGRLTASEEECFEAARKANIMQLFNNDMMNEMIDKDQKREYGKKIESRLEDKKNLISGGEKQRLCIARAFIKNPTILLLDEVTSSLDKDSELEVQKSLDKLSLNRTCISVSHRLNTIENCDQIYFLEKGKILEKGTHQELINLKGKYYTLQKYSNFV